MNDKEILQDMTPDFSCIPGIYTSLSLADFHLIRWQEEQNASLALHFL
jgi:hypothetical protein